MSLSRKLIIAISVLLLILLTGNLWINLSNARQYFAGQMQTLTEDAATSLAFSLSRVDLNNDKALVESMVDAVFDRGYYRSAVVTDNQHQVVVSRVRELHIDGVPQWFVSNISMPRYAGVANVTSGWYQRGEVTIIAHPGYLYHELWGIVKEQLWFFSFALVLCYGLIGLGLKRLLSPLTRIQNQAEAIGRKEFIEQSELPRTPELRNIIVAMNNMSNKVQGMFQRQVDLIENLRLEASMDRLTKLPVREEFDRQLETWLKSQQADAPGTITLLTVQNLEKLNTEESRESANILLQGLADIVRQVLGEWPRAIACRRTGSDFCVFIPGMLMAELEGFVSSLNNQVKELTNDLQFAQANIYLAGAGASRVNNPSVLLSAADTVLRKTVEQGLPRWGIDSADNNSALCLTARAWVERIKQVQNENTLSFDTQAVFDREKKILSHEMLARIVEEKQRVNAGLFWPIAERFHLVEGLDKFMIHQALESMEHHPDLRLSANVSPISAKSHSFKAWLARILEENPSSERLSLEFPERVLQMQEEDLIKINKIAKANGVRVGLDHFGLLPTALGSLDKLALDFVKIDQQFIHNVQRQSVYLKLLCQLAASTDVKIIAEGIETESQWQAALEVGIDGGQGYWLAKPKHNDWGST